MDDAVRFVASAGLAPTPDALVDLVLERHRQIQHGKYDRGRRKLPWVERRRGMLTIASSTAGGQRGVITKPEQIPLHAWRVYPALNYLRAAGGVL
jgi:hypothetical protein